MAKRVPLTFSEQDLQTLSQERFEHPDARVQQRMEVLWLISQGLSHGRAGELAGVSRATAERYVKIYRTRGVAGLRQFDWVKPVSQLEAHRGSLEEAFQKQPPHTVAEAGARIKEITGLERKPSQVRAFLKKNRFALALHRGHSLAAEENGRGTHADASEVFAGQA
jgi:transposase